MKTKIEEIKFTIVKCVRALSEHHILKIINGTDEVAARRALGIIFKSFYADGLWWVAMLRKMHKGATNKRFIQALADNIACETGTDGGTAHTQLMEDFAATINLEIDTDDPVYMTALKRAEKETSLLTDSSEAKRAGFMYGTEELFSFFLKLIRPATLRLFPNADMTYIDEHIEVDSNEHAIWMLESVGQIMEINPELFDEILSGIKESITGTMFPFNLVEENVEYVLF